METFTLREDDSIRNPIEWKLQKLPLKRFCMKFQLTFILKYKLQLVPIESLQFVTNKMIRNLPFRWEESWYSEFSEKFVELWFMLTFKLISLRNISLTSSIKVSFERFQLVQAI